MSSTFQHCLNQAALMQPVMNPMGAQVILGSNVSRVPRFHRPGAGTKSSEMSLYGFHR